MAFEGLANALLYGFGQAQQRRQQRAEDALRNLQMEGMQLQQEAMRQSLAQQNQTVPGDVIGALVRGDAGAVSSFFSGQGNVPISVLQTVAGALPAAGTFATQDLERRIRQEQFRRELERHRGLSFTPEYLQRWAESQGLQNVVMPQPNEQGLVPWDLFQQANAQALGLAQTQAATRATEAATEEQLLRNKFVEDEMRARIEQIVADTQLTETQRGKILALMPLEINRISQETRNMIREDVREQERHEFWKRQQEAIKRKLEADAAIAEAEAESIAERITADLRYTNAQADAIFAGIEREDRRLEHQIEQDQISNAQWEREFALKVDAQQFDQMLRQAQFDWSQVYQQAMLDLQRRGMDLEEARDAFNRYMQERAQEHREAVDRGELSLAEARLELDRDAQAWHQQMAERQQAHQERMDAENLSLNQARLAQGWAQIGLDQDRLGLAREQFEFERQRAPQSVPFSEIAPLAGIDADEIPADLRRRSFPVQSMSELANVVATLRRAFGEDEELQGAGLDFPSAMTLALRAYDTRYANAFFPEQVPSFEEFLRTQFSPAYATLSAIIRGEATPEQAQALIELVEPPAAPTTTIMPGASPAQTGLLQRIPSGSILSHARDYLNLARNALSGSTAATPTATGPAANASTSATRTAIPRVITPDTPIDLEAEALALVAQEGVEGALTKLRQNRALLRQAGATDAQINALIQRIESMRSE